MTVATSSPTPRYSEIEKSSPVCGSAATVAADELAALAAVVLCVAVALVVVTGVSLACLMLVGQTQALLPAVLPTC